MRRRITKNPQADPKVDAHIWIPESLYDKIIDIKGRRESINKKVVAILEGYFETLEAQKEVV